VSAAAAVTGALALARSYAIETMRSRTALFFTLLFPQLFLFVFAYVFAGGDSQRVAYLMSGVFTITTITSAFFGYSMHMVAERERGGLRRLRVTPTGAGTVVAGQFLHALVALLATLAFQFAIAKALFRFPIAGSPLLVGAVLAVGAVTFVALGLFVGCVSRDSRAAPALTNLIVFPMMFLSGSAMPFFALPGWVQRIGRLLPATYLNEALQRTIVQGRPWVELLGPVAALLAYAAVGLLLNALLFRWESTDRLVPRRLLLGLAALAAVVAAIALFGPELTMAQRPGV
jgi:ABC-2 type transport system permease protein